MHVVFMVPDGTGMRNYLFSDLLSQLQAHRITILHALPDDAVAEIKKSQALPLEFQKLPKAAITKVDSIFRDIITAAQLERNVRIEKNPAIRYSLPKLWNLKGMRKLAYRIIGMMGAGLSRSANWIEKAEQYHDKRLINSVTGQQSQKIIEKLKPDVIFCTHQRALEGAYIMAVANKLGIATISVIFSWDNLPKSRITTRSKYYLLWSDYMLNEMRKYYPLVAPERMLVTGTPQFQEYKNEAIRWSREKFESTFKIPPGKKVICFSGSDLSFPNDHLYLKDLIGALTEMPEETRPHLIVRPAPVDFSGRHLGVIGKGLAWITYAEPLWTTPAGQKSWTTVFPTPADNIVLINLSYHCDMVVNVGSTMSIDFAMFNKPSIYFNYEQPENPWFKISNIFNMQHFRTLNNLDAVLWVKNRADIGKAVLQSISAPHTVAADRLKWRYLIMNDIFDSTKRIAGKIESLVK
jgi:hypothetical protein